MDRNKKIYTGQVPPFELKLHLISSKSSPPTPYPKFPAYKDHEELFS